MSTTGFTREQLNTARYTDLYEWLLQYHEDEFIHVGDSIKLKDDHSVSIKQGTNLWQDFETGKGGNAISYLMTFYDYSYEEAVEKLLYGEDGSSSAVTMPHENPSITVEKEYAIPIRDADNRRVFAYLTTTRGIPPDTVNMLLAKGLLYQGVTYDKNGSIYHNAVFLNRKRDCYEIRGTLTYGKKFRNVGFTTKDRFWHFGSGNTIYICEGAIDCISLYELKNREEAIYVSMHGTGYYCIIDRILRGDSNRKVVLAVDNDDAGQKLRERYPQCDKEVPANKDWNEDLLAKMKLVSTPD